MWKKQYVEVVAAERLAICKECVAYDGECFVPGTGPCCGCCGCILKLKIRVMDAECEKGKWGMKKSDARIDEITNRHIDDYEVKI